MIFHVLKILFVAYYGIYEGIMNNNKLLAFLTIMWVIFIFLVDMFDEIKEVDK